MKQKLVLIGGGGHCKSVLDSLNNSDIYSDIVITDEFVQKDSVVCGCRVVGSDEVLAELFQNGFTNAAITVGSIKSSIVRHNIYEKIRKMGFCFPVIADLSAIISKDSQLGLGAFLGKKVIVNAETTIGDFAIVNTGAIIEHECNIGKFSHVAVGATICGGCNIGDNVFVGANATVIQGVKIGMNSIIGAGSIVLADVPDNTKVVGVWGGVQKYNTES